MMRRRGDSGGCDNNELEAVRRQKEGVGERRGKGKGRDGMRVVVEGGRGRGRRGGG